MNYWRSKTKINNCTSIAHWCSRKHPWGSLRIDLSLGLLSVWRFTCSPSVHVRFSGFLPCPQTGWMATLSMWECIPTFLERLCIRRSVNSWMLGPLTLGCIKSVDALQMLNIPRVDKVLLSSLFVLLMFRKVLAVEYWYVDRGSVTLVTFLAGTPV